MSNKHHPRQREVKREPREIKALRAPAVASMPAPTQEVSPAQAMQWNLERLQETITELQLRQEDIGWVQLLGGSTYEFDQAQLCQIARIAWLMWLKNPLIRRGVDVQAHYVFGQGINIRAEDEQVNEVVQHFLDDAKNKTELTSHQARMQKDQELAIFGNIFFVFFTNTRTNGWARVRTIPLDEIADIITDPGDAKTPWYYKRTWTERNLDGTSTSKTALYPDWRYRPKQKPAKVNALQVLWENPVYHVKMGTVGNMRYGVPEVYSAIDWAKAYKAFLEDWATLTRAYSRFAHVLTTTGGAKGVAAAKAKLGTTIGSGTTETNPPPVVGSTFIGAEGVNLAPYRIGGANVAAEDGRRLLLMVCAGLGWPETFFGDVSVGTLATATSLDRPSELRMRSRQTLWADVHRDILGYQIEQSLRAPSGVLKGGRITEDDDGTPVIDLGTTTDEQGQEVQRDATVSITFPSLLEHDVAASVGAIVDAATLKGSQLADTLDPKTITRLLLSALGDQDADATMDLIYPPEEEYNASASARAEDRQARADSIAQGMAATAQSPEMAEAARAVREALVAFQEKYGHKTQAN